MKKKSYAIMLFIIICILTVSCGNSSAGSEYTLNPAEIGFDFSAVNVDISYEVPTILPGVLVDQMGYEPENDKIVIFRESDLKGTFTIRDTESRSVVYTGVIKSRAGEGGVEEPNCFGDFSDFTIPGNYYIQVDKYGESYPFMIHDDLYYSMFQRAFKQLHNLRGGVNADGNSEGWRLEEKGNNKEISACKCMYRLLFSYELFPDVYTDEMGVQESGNGVPDILDECVYEAEWLIRQAQESPGADVEACGYRAAVLARCAVFVKPYDAKLAAQCQKAAEEAWKLMLDGESVSEDLMSLAAVELYRCTGGSRYAVVAEGHLKKISEEGKRLSELEFYSAAAYMNTRFKVSVELCETLIKKIMSEAEKITGNTKNQRYLVYAQGEETDIETLLGTVIRICVVNHVITNHEYNKVIENYFHYLMGCNPQAVCYASYWDGQNMKAEDLLANPVQNSAFLFMLSELLSNQS